MGLNSASVIRILDLLCEGPIDGIEGGRKGVYLDETPLKSSDGENTVPKENVAYEFAQGSSQQRRIRTSGYKTSQVINVGKPFGNTFRDENNVAEFITSYTERESKNKVKSRNYGAGELVVTVDDVEVDSIDLIFTVPRLFSTAQEGLVRGQLFDARIFFDVAVKNKNASRYKIIKKADVTKISEDFKVNGEGNLFYIEGISTSNYQYKISGIELEGEGPWDVRVRKYPQKRFQGFISHGQKNNGSQLSAGEIDGQIFSATFDEFEEEDKQTPLESGRANTLIWSSVVENFNTRLGYNYSALVGMSISTAEFQSLPTRAYLVRGRKVRIPKNAEENVRDDGSLRLVGNFNGSLSKKEYFTTCPVCIFYDLLTNKRYGAGHFIDETNLSWVDLYPLCQYANELVDGEPRFACNVQVSSQAEAFTVLQDFASVFRGMMYWQSNTIQLAADHGNLDGTNIDPVHIFSNSNVVGGMFNYSGSSLKTRSTSIKVRYSDPDNLYKPNIVCIEDADLITKYGYQVKEVLAFGCTSKTQAERMGRWMMKSEELDANTVTFAVGLDGALVFPGQVFAIQDELRANQRLSGRISSASTTTVVVDQTYSLSSNDSPKLTCVLRDGTVETRDINSDSSSGDTIVVQSAFTSQPLLNAVYSISKDSVKEQKFRCLSVSDNGDGTFAVVAVQFNDTIYTAVEEGKPLEFQDVTTLDKKPGVPEI